MRARVIVCLNWPDEAKEGARAVWGTHSPRGAVPWPDVLKEEIRAEEREGAVKRERKRESGSVGGRLRGSVGPPRRERGFPSLNYSPTSCPAPQLLRTLPQALAGCSATSETAKAGKGGKGKGVRCIAGLPAPLPPVPGERLPGLMQVGASDPWRSALVGSGVSHVPRNLG